MALHLMGAREIQERLGVARRQAQCLVEKADWPPPYDRLAMGKVWLRADVERWISRHRPALISSAPPSPPGPASDPSPPGPVPDRSRRPLVLPLPFSLPVPPGQPGPSSAGTGADDPSPEERAARRRPEDAELLAPVDWRKRLEASAIAFQQRRTATATARRIAAERRRHGMDSRNAWRQMMLDARAAREQGEPPPLPMQ